MEQSSTRSAARQRTERLQERTFEWAARVLDACPRQYPDDPSRTVWRQLIRAASSVSANLAEADEAGTDVEFLYRMKVVLRETREAKCWLQFVTRCRLGACDRVSSLLDEANQLAKIFATIILNRRRTLAAVKAAKRLL